MTEETIGNVLTERSQNGANVAASLHGSVRFLNGTKFNGSRTISASTTGSVVHNTVHHRSINSSPLKNKGQTPEWKKRLLQGNVAYGEQRDLFCSAATGLENMFRPPQHDASAGDSQSYPNDTTLPSSPPPYHLSRPRDDFDTSGAEPLDDILPDPDSPSPRRTKKDMKYRMTEEFWEDSRNSGADLGPGSDQTWPPRQPQPPVEPDTARTNNVAAGQPETRKTSTQSVVRNEDFSPILLSKQSSADGKVDFAPIELPAEQLRQRLEKLRINQMLIDSHVAASLNQEDSQLEESHNIETTEDYARNGGFLNLQRGGRSGEGSFRYRMLTPAMGTDTSEMLPEESLQASTPKQFPTVRTDGRPSAVGTMDQTPRVPRAPYPSPEKRPGPTGSPLKLFGPYDTFTNQTLMRRISQFEEPSSGDSSRSPRSNAEDVRSSVENKDDTQTRVNGSRRVSQFGVGQLEGYQFNEDISYASYRDSDASDLQDRNGGNASMAELPVLNFDMSFSTSPKDAEELRVFRKRDKSTASRQGRKVSASSRSGQGEGSASRRRTPDILTTPRQAFNGPESKRPRTSPSKDPTPKRRRTLHESDIAYGMDDYAADSAQNMSLHMQAIMGKKRKDARPGDLQQAANPNVMANRQILRPRTPTPSQRSSVRKDEHPFEEQEPSPRHDRLKRSPTRIGVSATAAPANEANAEAGRKPSIRTQDFLDEAGKIMAMIRSQVKPPSGLTSVEESVAENVAEAAADADSSYQESTREPFSRPPSREGRAVPRMANHQENPEIINHLRKYQEFSDMGEVISSSMRSLNLAKEAVRATQAMERQLRESIRSKPDMPAGADDHIVSDPPDVRISENPRMQQSPGGAGRDVAEFPSHSSGQSTNRSIPTGSSGNSESKNFIPPQNVSHLIGDQVGSMYLDKHKNLWVKRKASVSKRPARHVLPSEDSENDPFADIPDLSVDLTREMQQLRVAEAMADDEARQADMEESPSPSHTPYGKAGPGYITLSPDNVFGRNLASPAREELKKLGEKGSATGGSVSQKERERSVERSGEPGSNRTPSRKRNLTISFSSPIASIIQDVLPSDIDGLEDDPSVVVHRMRSTSASSTKSVVKHPQQRTRSTSRGSSRGSSRQLSVAGHAFVPRPVSRIDEQDEESTVEVTGTRERHVSIIGDRSLQEMSSRGLHQADLSFMVCATPGRQARAAVHPDAEKIIAHTIGNLSLSPLSEFTVNQGDDSFGLELSYMVGNRNFMTGDGSRRVMSITVRELVDRLTEVEPEEPFWEHLTELQLQDRRLPSLHMLDEFCPRVVTLNAAKNSLVHLDGVPSTVRELKVTYNLLTELTSWDHLANLQYVDVSNNQLKSLSALKNLVHLRNLKADKNQLTSLDELNCHSGLLSLRARDNQIEELDFEGTNLHRLTQLDLGGNQIKAVHGLDQLTALVDLGLDRNCLRSFTAEEHGSLPSLRSLDISDNELSILDIRHMPALQILQADRNMIYSISGLSRARRIDSLSLREQRGEEPLDMSFLDCACEVRKLFLSGNYMGQFEPTRDFLNLQLLELANCGLQWLPEGLGEMMPNLRSLNVNFNALTELAPFRGIPRLKKLMAAGNRLDDLEGVLEVLPEYPHLSRVDLRDNPITLGFYPPPLRVLLAPGSSPSQRSRAMQTATAAAAPTTAATATVTDQFTLPDADAQRDAQFARRLDRGTRERRADYKFAFLTSCRRLRMLDGLPMPASGLLSDQDIMQLLVDDGILAARPTVLEVDGEEYELEEPTEELYTATMAIESSRWWAEDSFA